MKVSFIDIESYDEIEVWYNADSEPDVGESVNIHSKEYVVVAVKNYYGYTNPQLTFVYVATPEVNEVYKALAALRRLAQANKEAGSRLKDFNDAREALQKGRS